MEARSCTDRGSWESTKRFWVTVAGKLSRFCAQHPDLFIFLEHFRCFLGGKCLLISMLCPAGFKQDMPTPGPGRCATSTTLLIVVSRVFTSRIALANTSACPLTACRLITDRTPLIDSFLRKLTWSDNEKQRGETARSSPCLHQAWPAAPPAGSPYVSPAWWRFRDVTSRNAVFTCSS